jgi:hypothetical protein
MARNIAFSLRPEEAEFPEQRAPDHQHGLIGGEDEGDVGGDADPVRSFGCEAEQTPDDGFDESDRTAGEREDQADLEDLEVALEAPTLVFNLSKTPGLRGGRRSDNSGSAWSLMP